jgi:hypothetical protein
MPEIATTTPTGSLIPWIHQSALNNSKIRTRERYWRTYRQEGTTRLVQTKGDGTIGTKGSMHYQIVPDAVTVRKYLPLISDLTALASLQMVLLESVVEYMDHRNQSPILHHNTVRESAANQERNLLHTLVEQGKMTAFCDLSVRDNLLQEDEFTWMQYNAMPIAERSRHALFRAARLLYQESVTSIIVASEEGLHKFEAEDGVLILSMVDLLDLLEKHQIINLEQHVRWIELMQVCDEEYTRRNAPDQEVKTMNDVCNYLSEADVQEGLRSKNLFRGRLVVSSENYKEAYVQVENKSFFVDMLRKHHNRAFHYDIVVIEPLPESQWGRPIGRRRLVFQQENNDDEESLRTVADGPAVTSARVVAISKPYRRTFVATLLDVPQHDDEKAVIVVPMDIKIPKIRIRTQSWRNYLQKRLWVQIDEWDTTSFYPQGRCLEIIGPIGDLETEVSCLLREQQVDLEPFSVAALACLPPEEDQWKVPQNETEQRRDLRTSRRIFSVDPPGCQDIDDTMHAKRLPNGDIEGTNNSRHRLIVLTWISRCASSLSNLQWEFTLLT